VTAFKRKFLFKKTLFEYGLLKKNTVKGKDIFKNVDFNMNG